jgi:hypothetical protein
VRPLSLVIAMVGVTLGGCVATIALIAPTGRVMERIRSDAHGIAVFSRLPPTGLCVIRGELTGFEVTVAKTFPCSLRCNTAISLPMRVDMRNSVTFTRASPEGERPCSTDDTRGIACE